MHESVLNDKSLPWYLVAGICFLVFLILFIASAILYGFTSNGRNQLENLYLFYFGKPEDFEKRWRYSLFLDRVGGRNIIADSVREINPTNLLKAVRKGAYINAYDNFGNTALHVATENGYPELVEILIKHGADRSYLNAQNRTAEQMIPMDNQESRRGKIDEFEKIEEIYRKYRNRKFRLRVPEKFPVSSFHVFVDERIDDSIADEYTLKFQSITADSLSLQLTHYVVKTSDNGLLETDDINLLVWIFNGVIIVKDTWIVECLKNAKMVEQDCDFLVKEVKYKGNVYDSVIHWSNAMAKGAIPYLYGVHVVVVMKKCANLATIASIVANHGGIMLDTLPDKENYNENSHPYLHNHLGPIFVIHDGTIDVDIYKNDPDKMFTVLTEEQFISFMLKRSINVNTSQSPIPILISDRDD